jgi:hypothetical protein
MAYIGTFDSTTIAPSDFSALPAGDYTCAITASEFKQSKAGGQYLALTYQVLEGPKKGRMIWHNLNLGSSNPQAVEISQRDLSAICHAVGKKVISDSAELHDIPHVLTLGYVPAKGEWPEKNNIKKWSTTGSASPATAFKTVPVATHAPVTHAPTPAAAAPAGTPPWKKSPAAPVAESIDDDVAF